MEPHDLERAGTALYRFHSGAPAPDDYERALDELQERLADRLAALGRAARLDAADGRRPRAQRARAARSG